MATIFEKLPVDKCLILEPREAFVYPFNVGDYSEIRMGGFFSVVRTGQEGNNLVGNDETNDPPLLPVQQFALGFTYVSDSDIPTTPRTENSFFIGSLTNTGTQSLLEYTSNRIRDSAGPGNLSIYFVTGKNNVRGLSNGESFQIPPQPSGNTAYARFNNYKLEIQNGTYNFIKANNNSTNYTDVSINNLRTLLLNATYDVARGITGYYTNDQTSSGTALNKPNAIYIYSPFLNNRLRIHTLLIERYS